MLDDKPKVPETKPGEARFIGFTKLQQGYLSEVRNRQMNEFSEAMQLVYQELGISEKMAEAPPGKYKIRQDLSGLDVSPTVPTPPEEPESEKPQP